MSLKRKKDKRDTKVIVLIGIGLGVLIILFIILFNRDVKEIKTEKEITNLTESYNKKNNTDIKTNTNSEEEIYYNDEEASNGEDMDIDNQILENVEVNSDNGDFDFFKGNVLDLTEEEVSREVEDFSLFLSDKINSKDLDSLYNVFNKRYIEVLGYEKEHLGWEYDFNGDIKIEITNTNVDKTTGSLFFTLKLIEKANNSFKIKDFTVFNDGSIADMKIDYIGDLGIENTIDDVTYSISDKINSNLYSLYRIKIKNNSEIMFDIKDMLIKNSGTIFIYETVSLNKNQLTSYPGIDLEFVIKVHNNTDIDFLELHCEDYNGNPYKLEILDRYNNN